MRSARQSEEEQGMAWQGEKERLEERLWCSEQEVARQVRTAFREAPGGTGLGEKGIHRLGLRVVQHGSMRRAMQGKVAERASQGRARRGSAIQALGAEGREWQGRLG